MVIQMHRKKGQREKKKKKKKKEEEGKIHKSVTPGKIGRHTSCFISLQTLRSEEVEYDVMLVITRLVRASALYLYQAGSSLQLY